MTYTESLSAIGAAADAEVASLKTALTGAQSYGTSADAVIATQRTQIAALEARIAELTAVTPPPVDPPAPAVGTLSWKPPTLTSPTTIKPTDGQGKIVLAAGRDYVIDIAGRTWKNTRGLHVEGGRNVVIIGGQVDVGAGFYSGGTGPGVMANGYVKRAAYFLGQTGVVHLEGVAFMSSSGTLSEGVNVSAPLARVQVQNVRLDSPLLGTKDANHADALQCWNGPTWLGVDGFTATTGYQGMFLNPHDTSTSSAVVDGWELRNVEIIGTTAAKYILWRVKPPATIRTTNVYTSGGLGNWNGSTDWPGVKHGTRAPVTYAPTAGVGYVSPGYAV